MNITDLLFALEIKKEADKIVETFQNKLILNGKGRLTDEQRQQLHAECVKEVLSDVLDTANFINKLLK
jgi:hypothetical protein